MLRKILFVILALLIVIQFFRPAKNLSGDVTKDLSTLYDVPDNVRAILDRSCNDCHSNKTVYPWYAHVQPVGWWLNDHIQEGKHHLNFNEFASLRVAAQKKKMEESMEQIKKNEMPLDSYTWIHRNSILSDGDKEILNAWCQKIIDTLKARYPADSLVWKRPKRD
jgi:hypothetical protein